MAERDEIIAFCDELLEIGTFDDYGPNGLQVPGAAEVSVVDVDGNVIVPEPGRSIALCRCGSSSTKPFCDRSHRESGFDGTTRWTGCFEVVNPGDGALTDKPGEPT